MVTAKKPSVEESMKKVQETWSKNNPTAIGSLYAIDAIVHDPMYPQPLKGRDAIKKDFEEFWKAFPDLQFKFADLITKSNTGAMRVNVSGTHKGPLAGPTGNIAATNKRMRMDVALFARFNTQGLIAEEHRYYDTTSMMNQLGIKAK